MSDLLLYSFAVLLALLTLPGTIELLLLTSGALLFKKKDLISSTNHAKIAIIIPAHNEEKILSKTLDSLKQCPEPFDCIVIADNCTDNTAGICQEERVRVIKRVNPHMRGKNHALKYGFDILLKENYDFFYIIDADTVVSPNFLTETLPILQHGADAVQVNYGVLNPERSIRTRLMQVALMAFNCLRPMGRNGWGWSAGILGNGFALSRKTLLKVPFQADSIVEDLAYHLRLVDRGLSVTFTNQAWVKAEMPAGAKAASTQRLRWEGGRRRLIKELVPALIKKIFQGNLKLIEPLLDLCLPPLAYYVLLMLILLAVPFFFTRIYAIIALFIVGLHVLTAMILCKACFKDYLSLLGAPFYLLWKLSLVFKKQNTSDWVRTKRNDEK